RRDQSAQAGSLSQILRRRVILPKRELEVGHVEDVAAKARRLSQHDRDRMEVEELVLVDLLDVRVGNRDLLGMAAYPEAIVARFDLLEREARPPEQQQPEQRRNREWHRKPNVPR